MVIGLGFVAAALMKANSEQKKFNDLLQTGSALEITRNIEETEEKIKKLEESLQGLGTNRSDRGTKLAIERDIAKANEDVEKLKLSLEDAKLRDLSKEFEMIKKNLTDSNASLEKNNIISKGLTEEARIRLEHEEAIKELEAQFEGKQLEELKLLQEQNLQHKLKGEQIKRNTEKAKELNNAFKKIGEDIGTGITDALVGAIEGTRTLGEAARSIINDLASSLLRLGINMALTGLFGGTKFGSFLGFANGGRPPVGRASIVGEKGPELFIPKTSGTIIPNNQIGGAGGGIVLSVEIGNCQGGGGSGATIVL